MTCTHTSNQTVAVIFALHARDLIEKLAATMPVWVIESPENSRAIADARLKYRSPLTIFFSRPNESKVGMYSRVLFDVDDHHPFFDIDLYGISIADLDSETLHILKIHSSQPAEYGCRLLRKRQDDPGQHD